MDIYDFNEQGQEIRRAVPDDLLAKIVSYSDPVQRNLAVALAALEGSTWGGINRAGGQTASLTRPGSNVAGLLREWGRKPSSPQEEKIDFTELDAPLSKEGRDKRTTKIAQDQRIMLEEKRSRLARIQGEEPSVQALAQSFRGVPGEKYGQAAVRQIDAIITHPKNEALRKLLMGPDGETVEGHTEGLIDSLKSAADQTIEKLTRGVKD